MDQPISTMEHSLSPAAWTQVVRLSLRYLTGYDLLHLAHASPSLYRGLLSGNSAVWRERVPRDRTTPAAWRRARVAGDKRSKPVYSQLLDGITTALSFCSSTSANRQDVACDWKTQYVTSFSLRFPPPHDDKHQHGSTIAAPQPPPPAPPATEAAAAAAAVDVPARVFRAWRHESFALDLWFALVPGSRHQGVGGILLSTVSHHWADSNKPHHHELVSVDHQGNLYCTMTDDNAMVKSNLELQRWYHLTLSFEQDCDSDRGTQRVYLDGKLMKCDENVAIRNGSTYNATPPVHERGFAGWYPFTSCQIGTSRCRKDAEAQGQSTPYSFNGIVDECRFWNHELTSSQIQQLYSCSSREMEAASVWSLKHETELHVHGEINCVRCTRPQERYLDR